MKTGLVLRYCIVVALVLAAWLLGRDIAPELMTLAGLALIVGATVWLIVSLVKTPRDVGATTRTWWRLVWDGFWGL